MPGIPNVIILGADAALAARPATPAQLANACYAAGYSSVIPASWGDELVAAACLRELAARGRTPVILASCPHVVERLRRTRSLVPNLLPLAAPPIAAARYLRARAGPPGLHITYIGECPGGSDPVINRHATPAALFKSLAKRGIDPRQQALEVDEKRARDARRFYSLPGGAPAPNWLFAERRGYTLLEPESRDYLAEIAHRVAERERRAIDLAPRLGCTCSGATVGASWTCARDAVAAGEPPRAVHEVLDHDVPVEVRAALEPWLGSASVGPPTLATPLSALAARFDPSAKAESVRETPPPPLPRRSQSMRRITQEPLTAPPIEPITATRTAPHPTPRFARRVEPSTGNGPRPESQRVDPTPVAPMHRIPTPVASTPITPAYVEPPARPETPPRDLPREPSTASQRVGYATPMYATPIGSMPVRPQERITLTQPMEAIRPVERTFVRVPVSPGQMWRLVGVAALSSAIVAVVTSLLMAWVFLDPATTAFVERCVAAYWHHDDVATVPGPNRTR